MRFLAGHMHHIKRRACHIGDHDRAVGGLAFDLRGAGVGVRLWPGVALGQQLGGQLGNHITVFGVHHRGGAKFGQTGEGRIKLVVIHHQRALIGQEVLERVDAALLHDGLHVVEHLLAPPSHRHVERIVTVRAGRFVVPPLQRVQQAFALVG